MDDRLPSIPMIILYPLYEMIAISRCVEAGALACVTRYQGRTCAYQGKRLANTFVPANPDLRQVRARVLSAGAAVMSPLFDPENPFEPPPGSCASIYAYRQSGYNARH